MWHDLSFMSINLVFTKNSSPTKRVKHAHIWTDNEIVNLMGILVFDTLELSNLERNDTYFSMKVEAISETHTRKSRLLKALEAFILTVN